MAKILIGNIKGPKGDQGIQGPKGEQGPEGPEGPSAPFATTRTAGIVELSSQNVNENGLPIGVANGKIYAERPIIPNVIENYWEGIIEINPNAKISFGINNENLESTNSYAVDNYDTNLWCEYKIDPDVKEELDLTSGKDMFLQFNIADDSGNLYMIGDYYHPIAKANITISESLFSDIYALVNQYMSRDKGNDGGFEAKFQTSINEVYISAKNIDVSDIEINATSLGKILVYLYINMYSGNYNSELDYTQGYYNVSLVIENKTSRKIGLQGIWAINGDIFGGSDN